VTTAPCVHCAKIIIASGIKCVIYKEIYKNDFGIKLLEEAGVLVISVESVVRAKEYNVF
jgi:dCMP deaminase